MASELKIEYQRLTNPETFEDLKDSYKIIFESGLFILNELREIKQPDEYSRDGFNLFQSTLLRSLSIFQLLNNPVNYKSESKVDASSNLFYDSNSFYCIVRSQYENYVTYNHIYANTKTKIEEKKFYYYLWVISGLLIRSKSNIESEIFQIQKEKEKLIIENLKESILNAIYFTRINARKKDAFKSKVGNGKWEFKCTNTEIVKIGFQEMMDRAGDNNKFHETYLLLSMKTYSTNVSVFQFDELFNKERNIAEVKFTIKISGALISFLIFDVCQVMPSAKNIFTTLNPINKALIDFNNSVYRGNDYILSPELNDLFENNYREIKLF